MTKTFDGVIHVDVDKKIAVITIDRPPVNAMNVAVRSGLLKALEFSAQSTDTTGICLIGSQGKFVSGADIKEFDEGPLTPSSIEIITALEGLEKPIVAAIEGVAFGGGLEIALACHYRVAKKKAALGQLEINLGLIPGAGGTQLDAMFYDRDWTVGSGALDINSQLINKFELSDNYPNPFNPSTNISFSLASYGEVTIVVFDALGREVNELVSDVYTPGSYNVVWNGTDFNGKEMSSGMYFYRLNAGEFTQTKKMLFMK